MNCTSIESRHDRSDPLPVDQKDIPYPTLSKINISLAVIELYASHYAKHSPKSSTKTTNHSNMIHDNQAASSLGWSNFTAACYQPTYHCKNKRFPTFDTMGRM